MPKPYWKPGGPNPRAEQRQHGLPRPTFYAPSSNSFTLFCPPPPCSLSQYPALPYPSGVNNYCQNFWTASAGSRAYAATVALLDRLTSSGSSASSISTAGATSLVRTGEEVPERDERMEVAVHLPVLGAEPGQEDGGGLPLSHGRERLAEGGQACVGGSRGRLAGERPHAQTLIRYSPARIRIRHQDDPRVARAQGPLHDDDLHPRAQEGRDGGQQPRRLVRQGGLADLGWRAH